MSNAVANSATRYTNVDRSDDISAAPTAPAALAMPTHRCHSSEGVASRIGDEASSHPEIRGYNAGGRPSPDIRDGDRAPGLRRRSDGDELGSRGRQH
jgi:hypothetical protein